MRKISFRKLYIFICNISQHNKIMNLWILATQILQNTLHIKIKIPMIPYIKLFH